MSATKHFPRNGAPSALGVALVDGCQVRERGPGWGKKKTQKNRGEWHELKLGVFYRQEEAARTEDGEAPPDLSAWVEPWLHQLRHGPERAVLGEIARLKKRGGVAGKVLAREQGYFAGHARRMNYQEVARRGWPIGSGAVESACRQKQCRFKRAGQFWTRPGLRHLSRWTKPGAIITGSISGYPLNQERCTGRVAQRPRPRGWWGGVEVGDLDSD